MKKIFYTLFATALSFPVFVSAALTKPDSAGLPEIDSATGVIDKLIEFFAGLIGVIAILMIVVSGIMYMTSGGDEGRIATAKKMLIFAIVGLVVALLGYLIVYIVWTTLSTTT